MADKGQIIHGYQLDRNRVFSGDVIVIGTGAGGGVTAEILSKTGLKVILLEEGGYKTSKDFHMSEAEAYTELYYDVASRKTKDKAITVLQGRTVGGSTTVNWVSCFRTPPATLAHWTKVHGLRGFGADEMSPWFEQMEKRLSVAPWRLRNPNNDVLSRGAGKLGWHTDAIPRNVKGCRNLGYCGMGCPVDAKQSMLVTTIPAAIENGATLLANVRAVALDIKGDRVIGVDAIALKSNCVDPTGIKVRAEAPRVVLAGGGINNPALLLRSKAPDPHRRVGRRTFLHVTNASFAIMPEKTNPFEGAPQSVYSDQFLYRDGVAGRLGYKLEIAPLHPVSTAVGMLGLGQSHADSMARLPYLSPAIALMRDGFNADSVGGTVTIADDGSPVLDYPIDDYVWDGLRHAYLSMAECQFAAGASRVALAHMDAPAGGYASWPEAKQAIKDLPAKKLHAQLFSAHVMGGCGMGEDPKTSVVDSGGKYHQLANLWILDGSIFPTSIGANPSLSIYAMVARQATALAQTADVKKAATA
jgi:choline dehydrogenase-like flavoprotein